MPRYKQPTQRHYDFARFWGDPASDTYDNIAQSAMKAGYSEEYARRGASKKLVPIARKILNKESGQETERVRGLSEKHQRMLEAAEKAIEADLKIPDDAPVPLRTIRQRGSHFIAERIGKDIYHTKNVQETKGHVQLPSETLHAIANTLNNLSEGARPPREAHTVRVHEHQETPLPESDTKNDAQDDNQ